MLTTTISFLRRNALACTALAVGMLAMAGSSYAAFSLPPNSVGAVQIQNHSIAPAKLDPQYTNGTILDWAYVSSDGRVLGGGPGVSRCHGHEPGGCPFEPDNPGDGSYGLAWHHMIPAGRRCATVANVVAEGPGDDGFAAATIGTGYSGNEAFTLVDTYNLQGQPTPENFYVAVIC
jgi:hypothetical protein